MNVLIVHAHPDPRAFITRLKLQTLDVMKKQGHLIQVSNLYEMHFKAYVSLDDFIDPFDSTRFDLHTEQRHASINGTFSPDILEEQQKLIWADAVLFFFPLWWYSMPAILKGWFDRVFAYGFAYGETSLLSGKKAMLSLTTGGPPRPYTIDRQQAMRDMLNPIQRGTLHFCGFDVLPPYAAYGADYATREQQEQHLLQHRQILLSFDRLAPIVFDM